MGTPPTASFPQAAWQWTDDEISALGQAAADFGLDGYRALIAHDLEMAAGLARRVEEAGGLELLAAGLSICCFRARAAGLTGPQTDELNRALLAELQLGGSVFVTGTTVSGAFALRACIVNPGTGPGDVTAAVELITETAARLSR